MKTNFVMLIVLLVALSGCANAPLMVTPELLNAAGVNIDNGVATIADASVLKELAVHRTLQNRDLMIKEATLKSGFKSKWQQCSRTVFYPGMKKPLTVTEPCLAISYTPMPEFKQPLPVTPSIHPGYKMAENIVHDVANATLIGYGISVAGDVLKQGYNAAGSDYSNSTYEQSFNNGSSTNTGRVSEISTVGAE